MIDMLTELEQSISYYLAFISRRSRQVVVHHPSGKEVTYTQATLLATIKNREGQRQVELAERMGVQPITLGRLLDQLVAQGLIERRQDPNDRRAFVLHVPDNARQTVEDICESRDKIIHSSFRGLKEADLQQMVNSMHRMYQNITEKD